MDEVLEEDVRSLIVDMEVLGKIDKETAEEALDLLEQEKPGESLKQIRPYFRSSS